MITLTNPIAVREVTGLEVRSVQFEANAERGQKWVDVWCDYGFEEGPVFRAYPIPGCTSPTLHLRFENGVHPLRPGKMLGRCGKCGAWAFATSGACSDPKCDGTVGPYAAHDELMAALRGATGDSVLAAVERHLTNATFPSVNDTKATGPLIKGSV
jgi:hypothetical protein